MQLLELNMLNWCQHRHRTVMFTPGLNAIIGPNGSGKSNIMDAVYWLLTGQNPKPGKKEENVCQLADPAERANATLRLRHRDDLLAITRHLKPASPAVLTRNGVTVATGEEATTKALLEVLNTDARMLRRFVLVGQRDITGFLSEDPAERGRSFQKLFDTERCEPIHRAISNHLTGLVVQDYVGQVRVAEEALQRIDQEIATQMTALQAYPAVANYQQLQLHDQSDRDQMLAANATVRRYSQLSEEAGRHLAAITAATPELQKLESDLRLVQQAANDGEAATLEARTALANWENHQRVLKASEALQQRRQELETKQRALRQPSPPIFEKAVVDMAVTMPGDTLELQLINLREDLSGHVTRMLHEIENDQRVLHQFADTGLTECPTCHTPVTSLGGYMDKLREGMYEKEAKLEYFRSVYDKTLRATSDQQQYTQQVVLWEQHTAQLKEELERLQQQAANFLVETIQAVAVDDLKQQIATQAQYLEAVKTLQPAVTQRREQIASLEGQLSAVNHYLAEILANNNGEPPQAFPTGKIAAVEQRMQQRESQNTMHTTVATAYERATAQRPAAIAALESARITANQSGKVVAWRERAEQWQALFHREGLPRFVARKNLDMLQVRINETLDVFETDFHVTADSKLSFEATFRDGRKQPAHRLSGGQEVVLALAFRVAINSIFAESISLLGLDEPTIWLDKHHLQAFAPVLDKLRSYADSRGLQCVIVTHQDELRPHFSSVIQL